MKEFGMRQWVGVGVFVVGLYLVISSILTIHTFCGECEKPKSSGHSLGWLGLFNPALGVASMAQKKGDSSYQSKYKNAGMVSLIIGIVLTNAGTVLLVYRIKK